MIATNNVGKAKEFAEIFEPKGYSVKTLRDFPELEEVEGWNDLRRNARLRRRLRMKALSNHQRMTLVSAWTR